MTGRVPFLDLRAATVELKPEIDAALLRVSDSGWYLLGDEIKAFERAFADHVGARHCVGLANGLDALHLGLRALGAAKPALLFRDDSVILERLFDRKLTGYLSSRVALVCEARVREQERAAAVAEGKEEAVEKVAAGECVAKRLVTGSDALEEVDDRSGETALITRALLGDAPAVDLLLLAKARPDAKDPVSV